MGLKFKIKKYIISQHMLKNKKEHPFIEKDFELYTLPKDADEMVNNSYFFSGSSIEKKETMVMRLGERINGLREVFVFYRKDNDFYVNDKDYYTPENVPLKVECIEPSKEWKVNFSGILFNQATGEPHKVSFEFIWKATLPIFDFYYSFQNPYMIDAVANCKWDQKFKEAMARNNQHHYEQCGHLNGTLYFDGEKSTLDLVGGRDRAMGWRDWNDMAEHIWLLGLNDKGEIFNYSLVDYPLLKNIQNGYTSLNKGKIVTSKKNEIIQYSYNDGKACDELKLRLTLTDGEVLNVTAKREFSQRTEYQNGAFYFQEGIGEIDVNGTKFYGSIEFGFNKDPSRWEKREQGKSSSNIRLTVNR